LPAKNDDAVSLKHRGVFFAGKPRSYGGTRAAKNLDSEQFQDQESRVKQPRPLLVVTRI